MKGLADELRKAARRLEKTPTKSPKSMLGNEKGDQVQNSRRKKTSSGRMESKVPSISLQRIISISKKSQ